MSALSDVTNEAPRTIRIKNVLNKALEESVKKVFDGNNDQQLQKAFKELVTPELKDLTTKCLDGIAHNITNEFNTILDNHKVNEKMLRLEELIAEAAEEEKKANGKASPVLECLPEGVSPADVLRMNAYELKLAEKVRLEGEIQQLATSNESIEKELKESTQLIGDKLKIIEEQRKKMQLTADLCSNVSR